MWSISSTAVLLFMSALVSAQTTTPPSSTSAASPSITAVSDCHAHGTVQFCVAGTAEYEVVGPTKTEEMEPRYTGCHTHGSETFCVNSSGEDVEILIGAEEEGHNEDSHSHETEEQSHASEGRNCHFHAGVEHCVGGAEDSSSGPTCTRQDRSYNKPLRIGLLFVILATSALGVFAPILATRFTRMSEESLVFVAGKQFGTGVILSTAFIHLFTHAQLMFSNECLGELSYEGTTAAVFLAGLVLSFLVDYLGVRFLLWRQRKNGISDAEVAPVAAASTTATMTDDKSATPTTTSTAHRTDKAIGHVDVHSAADAKLNVLVLEAGIIFHSLLIGLTLVVAGDSFFLTLFAVILFHQTFEGVALGTCIAALPSSISTASKLIMAGCFALVTPLGMGIGIGVLDKFNGNDPATLVAIGTLDALSAGILAWVGIVEMLNKDWMEGSLREAGWGRTLMAGGFLGMGLVGMSVLGKWA